MELRLRFFSLLGWAWIILFSGLAPNVVLSKNLSSDMNSNFQILVLDISRVLTESSAGQLILDRYKEQVIALNNEFNNLQTQLIAEEQELRDVRATMDVDAFVQLAEAFDKKSNETREEYRTRKQSIDDRLNEHTDRLARLMSQYAGEVMEEKGASLVLMKNQVIVSSNAIDITSVVMEKANQLINVDAFLKLD